MSSVLNTVFEFLSIAVNDTFTDVIFSIFKPPYLLKVEELEHEINSKKFELHYFDLRIDIVKAEIQKVEAEFANNQYLANQAKMMLLIHVKRSLQIIKRNVLKCLMRSMRI